MNTEIALNLLIFTLNLTILVVKLLIELIK